MLGWKGCVVTPSGKPWVIAERNAHPATERNPQTRTARRGFIGRGKGSLIDRIQDETEMEIGVPVSGVSGDDPAVPNEGDEVQVIV